MAEEQKEPQEVTTKEPQQVTIKNLIKLEAGKRLALHNRKKRDEKKAQSKLNQYYDTGAVIAVGVIGDLGYYIYCTKKGESPSHPQPPQQPPGRPCPQTSKSEMD